MRIFGPFCNLYLMSGRHPSISQAEFPLVAGSMSFVDGDLLFSVVVVCIKRTSANLRLADERHTLKVVTLAPLTQESSSVARGTGSGGPTAMRRRLARSSRRAGWRRAPHSLFRATAGPHLSAPRQRIAKRFRTPDVRRILP